MNKSFLIYAAILVLSLGASWVRYTSEEVKVPKEGVVLLDLKKDDLQVATYTSPDLTVAFEVRKDSLGSYGWVTVTEKKKKKVDGQDVVEEVVTRFKAGADGDKLIDALAPMMVLRELGRSDDKIESYGLKAPTTSLTIVAAGRTINLDVGGETYGSKDFYVRDQATGMIYVLDDEFIKKFKFAKTKLRDNMVFSAKKEDITSIKVMRGASVVTWDQKNISDRAAAFWARSSGDGAKDVTFSNWLDKFLKVRSTDFVDTDPPDLVSVLELTITPQATPPETLQIYKSGEDWYARGAYTRALVKLNKATISDAESEIDDVLEGKEPPPKAEAPAPSPDGQRPPGMPGAPDMAPGAPPSGLPHPLPPRMPAAPGGK